MVIVLFAATIAARLPEIVDIHGWSLRVQPSYTSLYIVGETYQDIRVHITLMNKSGEARKCPPLEEALRTSELTLSIRHANGKSVSIGETIEPFPIRQEKRVMVNAGESISIALRPTDFGFTQFIAPGKYSAQMRLKTPQGVVVSRVWTFDVMEPDATTILATHTVPLDEHYAKAPLSMRYLAFIEQVKVGDQVLLLYRSYWGGTVRSDRIARCIRLAELSGKVEMKCTGEYGKGKQLTITYADRKSPSGTTTLVIDSRGEPWSFDPSTYSPKDDPIPPPRPIKP